MTTFGQKTVEPVNRKRSENRRTMKKQLCNYCGKEATRQVEEIHMCQSCYEYELEQGYQEAEKIWAKQWSDKFGKTLIGAVEV